MAHPPLTCADVIEALTKLVEIRPHMAEWPVHLLDMESEDDEDRWGGLVTHIETDCFAEEQGKVVSLLAWRHMPHQGAHPGRRPESAGGDAQ